MPKKNLAIPPQSSRETTGPDSPPHDHRWREAKWRQLVQRRLLKWFYTSQRVLPWRQNRDPYRVWLSEVMLQQTQVNTVIPYFQRFLKRYPTVRDLAAADEHEVLQLWEGLGYYRRARQLHAAARKIAEEYDGRFPEAYAQVLALPGIGRYTAGAILSIALNQRLPIVEANTQRLYSRLIAQRWHPTQPQANALLWEFAETILPRKAPGQFNQAAMELGALICLPKAPKCLLCPLRQQCAAHELGLEAEIPGKVKKLKYEQRDEFVLLVAAGTPRRYFVHQVPEGGRWAGLWDFPRFGPPEVTSAEEAARRLAEDFGIRAELGPVAGKIKHGVTRFRITLHVHHATAARRTPSRTTRRWCTPAELEQLPLNVTARKLAKDLASADWC